jgi:hypothetical protein
MSSLFGRSRASSTHRQLARAPEVGRAKCPSPARNPHLIHVGSPGNRSGTRNFPHRASSAYGCLPNFVMMKREGSAPDLGCGIRGDGTRGERPRTEEFDVGEDERRDGAAAEAVRPPMPAAEVTAGRDRRVTRSSPIPAAMADAIVRERSLTPRRDPAAPRFEPVEETRRVGESDPVRSGSGPTSPSDTDVAPWRHRAAQRIDEARAALDAGDLSAAVTAAEAALHEADRAPAPGIVEVIEPARPLLNRVFTTYIGPSTGLPILAPRAEEIARQRLGDRERAVLRRIDGSRTLEELFDGSGLGSMDALRIVARLIRSGAIRVV